MGRIFVFLGDFGGRKSDVQIKMDVANYGRWWDREQYYVLDFLKNFGLAAEPFLCSKKETPGSCSVMHNSHIKTESCDKKLNFICEAKKYELFSLRRLRKLHNIE